MLSQRSKETAYAEASLDGALFGLAFTLASVLRSRLDMPFFAPSPVTPEQFGPHLALALLAIPTFWTLAGRAGLYEPLRTRGYLDIAWIVARSIALTGLLLGTTIFVLRVGPFSRAIFFLFLMFSFALVAGSKLLLRLAAHRMPSSDQAMRNVLIVGVGDEALDLRRRLEAHPEYALRVIGHVPGPSEAVRPGVPVGALGSLDDLARIVEERVIDDVLFVVPAAQLPACEKQVAWCEEVGISVHLKMDLVRTLFARSYATIVDGVPMLTISCTPRDPVALVAKRLFDVVVSAAALVVLSPILVACSLAVALTSPGGVVFRQERVGLNGRAFTLYKFRTMIRDAEARKAGLAALNEFDGPAFKIKLDPRVTMVGRFLRTSSLDELPQLWNILRGDMSLVGPRPIVPSELKQVERWQRRRLSMKPGLTCLWQISGRSDLSFEEWMRLDLLYIDSWSLGLDFAILLRTVPAVMLARGAH